MRERGGKNRIVRYKIKIIANVSVEEFLRVADEIAED